MVACLTFFGCQEVPSHSPLFYATWENYFGELQIRLHFSQDMQNLGSVPHTSFAYTAAGAPSIPVEPLMWDSPRILRQYIESGNPTAPVTIERIFDDGKLKTVGGQNVGVFAPMVCSEYVP